jgi:hypothetical protein
MLAALLNGIHRDLYTNQTPRLPEKLSARISIPRDELIYNTIFGDFVTLKRVIPKNLATMRVASFRGNSRRERRRLRPRFTTQVCHPSLPFCAVKYMK